MGKTMYLECKKAVFLCSRLLYWGCGKVIFEKNKAPSLGVTMAVWRCIIQMRHQTHTLIWAAHGDESAHEGRT